MWGKQMNYPNGDNVKFAPNIEVSPIDGGVSFFYKENDPWYGLGQINISLEELERLVKFAQILRATYMTDVNVWRDSL